MPPLLLSKTKAQEFKGLALKKNRSKKNLFLAEGDKCVTDMLGSFEIEALICNERWFKDHQSEVQHLKERILISDQRTLDMISTLSTPSGVIAVFKIPATDEIFKLKPTGLYVLLDTIQDPGNLGTIIRTCDWFGVYEIFASNNTVDVYSPKVVQATMGSLNRVRVHYTDLSQLINENKEIPLIGMVLDGKPLNSVEKLDGGMLLLGNEGNGISKELMEKISLPLTILPYNLHNHPDSLNVGIANAVMLSYFRNLHN